MNTNGAPPIKTIDLIERMVQPYSDKNLEVLKNDLFCHPDHRVVHLWTGNHLDDREIYDICTQSGLQLAIREMHFSDVNEAAVYVCKNQMKRPDLTSEYMKYLIGQRYHYEMTVRLKQNPNDSKMAIASMIATEHYISAGTVKKYYFYAIAMNTLFDQDMMFAKDILSGKLKISHENTLELSRLRPDEIKAIAKSVVEERIDHITWSYIRSEVKWSHIQPRSPKSRREKREEKAGSRITIRQMPEYDPDAEVNSLCMTIDSWISSIKRVSNSDNFPKITAKASLRLMKKLSQLENTINSIQEELVERTGV